MDASALRNFLLKEVESRPIQISASRLARVESERRPTKIFQYSDGAIEQSIKDDSGYGMKLRKTSSVSSADSGFSMTPNSPNVPLPLPFLSPAPYVSVDHLIGNSSRNGQDDVTSSEENDSLLRHSSPSPPPLPSSRPPSFIKKRNILAEIEVETSAHNLKNENESLSADKDSDYKDQRERHKNSWNDENTSGDSTSDSEGYHDDTTAPQFDSPPVHIPIEISKLEDSIKTVRSSIKRGTVHDMKKLFKVKTKRSKKTDVKQPKKDNSDQNFGVSATNKSAQMKRRRRPGNLSIGDMLEQSNFYPESDESDSSSDNDAMTENLKTFDTESIVLQQDFLDEPSPRNQDCNNAEIEGTSVQSCDRLPCVDTSSNDHNQSANGFSKRENDNSHESKYDCSSFIDEKIAEITKQSVLLELDLLQNFQSLEDHRKEHSNSVTEELNLSNAEINTDVGPLNEHVESEISYLETKNVGIQPKVEKLDTPSIGVNTTSIDDYGESNTLPLKQNESYTCETRGFDDAHWTQHAKSATATEFKLQETDHRNHTEIVSCNSDFEDDMSSKAHVCMENRNTDSPSLNITIEAQKIQADDTTDRERQITDSKSDSFDVFGGKYETGARDGSKENVTEENAINCDFSNEHFDKNDTSLYPLEHRNEQNGFSEYETSKVVNQTNEEYPRNAESTNEIDSIEKDIKPDEDGTLTPKKDDLCNKNVVKVRSEARSRDNGIPGSGKLGTCYVSNTEKDVYCETNDSTLQVTMTSGDEHTRQAPVLINYLKASNQSDVGNFNTYVHRQNEVDNIQNDNSKDQRGGNDLICEEDDGDFSSESSYVADKRSIEASYGELSDSDERLDSDKSIKSADGDKVIQVKRDLNQVNDSFNSESTFSNNLQDISDLSDEEAAEVEGKEITVNKGDNLKATDLVDDLRGVADVAILCSGILNQKAENDPNKNYDYGQPETLKPWVTDVNTPVTNDKARDTSSVYSKECSKADACDKKLPSVISHAKDSSSHAYLSSGKHSAHVTSTLTSALTNSEQSNQVTNCSDTSAVAHRDHSRDIPEFYSLPDTFKSSKIVTLKEIPARRRRMPERSSGYTSSDSETSSYTGGRRVSTRTETLQSSKGGKITELKEGELESNIHVQHLAETISKLTGDNTEEYLPDINQTVTKIPGGNLVITTLTHKVVEEEEEDENKTKNGPDDDNSRYIVQDHTGQYYYVEDITDETQESAYYSSSGTQNSSYDGYGQNSRDFHGIQNLQAVGKSSIGYDTAEEVLLGLYNSPGTMEIHEYDEREYEERSGQYKGAVQPYGMTNNSSMNKQTTSYEYDNSIKRPVPHNIGSSTVKTMKHMYEMESSAPWVTDGTTSQQIQEGEAENEVKRESMQTTETHADQTGMNSMCAAYMLQSSASVIPSVPQPPVVPPPVIYPPVVPQYRVAKVDFTPAPILTSTPQVSESHTQTEVVEEKEVKYDRERPIFKTVALVKGPYEAPKWKQTKEREDDSIKYKVVNSRASEPLQEETVEYEENVKTMSTYKMEKTGFDENSNLTMPQYVNYPSEQQRYRTEKVFQINGTSPSPSTQKSFQTKINVGGLHRDIEAQRRPEHSHYEYIKETQRDGGYHVNDEVDRPSDMRVVRGNILIKNTMDQDLEDYNDNINLFDRTFNMSKDNPLYQSDEDLYKRFEREQEMEKQRQRRLDDRLNQDITFETVDRFTKSKEVKRIQEKQRPKKNLSQLLLTRIASLDSKDIRQHIDVKHHNEDIFGDINLIHADGTRGRSTGTSNFDSVDENVDLVMKDGKAFITIKVTAERISPIDLEFNVWRKSQAIVTRVIEIDFFANEQRRRLYENVMDRAGGMDREYERLGTRRHGSHGYKARETVLSSQETLDLFSEIMEAADGEGDNEDITVKTSQRKTFLPKNSMDFLY